VISPFQIKELPEKYARQSGSSSQIISQMGLLSKKIFESTNQR